MIGETLDELDIIHNTVGVCPVGCAVFMYEYISCDMIEAAHGRAPAVATGVKRVLPDRVVFCLPGRRRPCLDRHGGDNPRGRAGREHIGYVHQQHHLRDDRRPDGPDDSARPEIDDLPIGQRPARQRLPDKSLRDARHAGWAVVSCEGLPHQPGGSGEDKESDQARIRKADRGQGFSLVEVLCNCPTQWRMTPIESLRWIDENMTKVFPPGEFVDR